MRFRTNASMRRALDDRDRVATRDVDGTERLGGQAGRRVVGINAGLGTVEVEQQVEPPVTVDILDVPRVMGLRAIALTGIVGVPEADAGRVDGRRVEAGG